MSAEESYKHIQQVQKLLGKLIRELTYRQESHDITSVDGSEEFAGSGSDAHYLFNPHHPEFYKHGVRDMSLVDLMEMLIDWKSKCLTGDECQIESVIEANQKRFGFSDEIKQLLINTLPLVEDD